MKKNILGKEVEISNIKSIEKAFEGMVIASRSSVNNDIVDKISLEGIDCASDIINEYFKIYDCLPFPLNCIEEKIKYACIAMLIQYKVDKVVKFKVAYNGLIVGYNDTTGIFFSNTCWKLVYTKGIKWEDFVDIGEYRKHPSYSEFEWVVSKIMDGESLEEYYEKFMKSVYDACGGDSNALRRELANILYIQPVPKNIVNIRENSIIELGTNNEYTIDVYMHGKVRTGQESLEIFMDDKGYKTNIGKAEKIIYNFDVYSKKIIPYSSDGVSTDINIKKISNVQMSGFASIFERLIKDGIENMYNKVFRGVKKGNVLVFCINGNLLRTKAYEYDEPELIDTYVDIVGTTGNKVYYYSKDRLQSGVIKNTLYKLDVQSGKSEVCIINFE